MLMVSASIAFVYEVDVPVDMTSRVCDYLERGLRVNAAHERAVQGARLSHVNWSW